MAPTSNAIRPLRVAELAAAAGVSPDTVRYYERTGLLIARRTATGYRVFDESALERIGFVRGCQRLGLRLREIADLLAVRDTGVCPCEPADLLLRRRLDEVDAEMARLTALRAQLTAMIGSLPAPNCLPPRPGAWLPN